MLTADRMLALAAAIIVAGCHQPAAEHAPPTTSVAVDDRSPTPAQPHRPRVGHAAGIDPKLLQALQQAVADSGDGAAQISVRVVTPDDCGPTVAPGSDCMVGTVAAADE
jgi:hypothetical protein